MCFSEKIFCFCFIFKFNLLILVLCMLKKEYDLKYFYEFYGRGDFFYYLVYFKLILMIIFRIGFMYVLERI